MRDMGQFAREAEPWATGLVLTQVALVLPQSLQLSVLNEFAVQTQQNAVRTVYQYARSEAYAVGEYQIQQLGSPKLIIIPSAFLLTSSTWQVISRKVKDGSTLLVSGPFDLDEHFHPTDMQDKIGLPYKNVPLTIRDNGLDWPNGNLYLSYPGDTTTYLSRAVLPNDKSWAAVSWGKGKVLFSAFPLELNSNLQAVGDVYRYALKLAGVSPAYRTAIRDAGILICPHYVSACDALCSYIGIESNRGFVSGPKKREVFLRKSCTRTCCSASRRRRRQRTGAVQLERSIRQIVADTFPRSIVRHIESSFVAHIDTPILERSQTSKFTTSSHSEQVPHPNES